MQLTKNKMVRTLTRILSWPREKRGRFWQRYNKRLLWKLEKEGVGEQISYDDWVDWRKEKTAIRQVNREMEN